MKALQRAEPADLDTLLQLDSAAGTYPWPHTALERALEAGQVWKLAIADQTLGFLVESRVLDETTLMHLAVDGRHQGRGHARQALSGWLEQLARDGQNRCFLEVRFSNYPARHLYESLGFTKIGIRPDYYPADGGFEDAIVMEIEFPRLGPYLRD